MYVKDSVILKTVRLDLVFYFPPPSYYDDYFFSLSFCLPPRDELLSLCTRVCGAPRLNKKKKKKKKKKKNSNNNIMEHIPARMHMLDAQADPVKRETSVCILTTPHEAPQVGAPLNPSWWSRRALPPPSRQIHQTR